MFKNCYGTFILFLALLFVLRELINFVPSHSVSSILVVAAGAAPPLPPNIRINKYTFGINNKLHYMILCQLRAVMACCS